MHDEPLQELEVLFIQRFQPSRPLRFHKLNMNLNFIEVKKIKVNLKIVATPAGSRATCASGTAAPVPSAAADTAAPKTRPDPLSSAPGDCSAPAAALPPAPLLAQPPASAACRRNLGAAKRPTAADSPHSAPAPAALREA